MKSNITKTFVISLFGLSALNAFASQADKHILMVLSSYGEKNEKGEWIKPGFEFDEMSKSYLVFKSAGAKVTFASPKGGALLADKFDLNKTFNKRFLSDEHAQNQLANTHKLSTLDSQDYDAVFVVGGKGPMFDLVGDPNLKQHIKTIYERDGVVGAVCHGPAALLGVKLSDGRFLVDGKRISAFTNLEESVFTKKWSLPFSLADKLIEQGAEYQQDGLMLHQVSIDGNVITGQNPFSTTDTAIALVNKLGLTVQSDVDFKDDRTIKLAERFFDDKQAATEYFQENKSLYDTMLLAMIGVYQSKHAQSQAQRDGALAIMLATQSDVKHPMLAMAIAKAYEAKNNPMLAKRTLIKATDQFPNNRQLSDYLDELGEK